MSVSRQSMRTVESAGVSEVSCGQISFMNRVERASSDKGLRSPVSQCARKIDPLIVMKMVIWNVVLLFLGLFIGFVIVQHAMFYTFPPNPDAFLYVQREVYVVFSIIFVVSVRTLSFVESRIRGLATS